MNTSTNMNLSLESILGKKAQDFSRRDLLTAIHKCEIKQINLYYRAIDGKMKELKVPINDMDYAEMILAQGERIDGSSTFKGAVNTEKSDLYIIPQYASAFISPFSPQSLGIMCTFLDHEGKAPDFVPENILKKAHQRFKEKTGHSLHALGELEFYLIYDRCETDHRFPGTSQRSYHQSTPFVRGSDVVNEMMRHISQLTGAVKYCHSEVGYIPFIVSENKELHGKCAEQFEIEFLLRPVEEMASMLALSKWIVRNVAHRHGMSVTFAPKIMEGMAGNGLHFHLGLFKGEGRTLENVTANEDGSLNEKALQMMASICDYAPSLSAFGNTVASSYKRLVANQEAPINICWSEQNRQALVRVPLGWKNMGDVAQKINSSEKESYQCQKSARRQTVEYRAADGSANIELLLAALTLACTDGILSSDSLKKAHQYHVVGKVVEGDMSKGKALPHSCVESALCLEENRRLYEVDGIFTSSVINYMSEQLKKEKDMNLAEDFTAMREMDREKLLRHILHKDLHKY